jgi:predicted GTPase
MNKETTNVLLIGKSRVGKSSLLNYIFGREMQEVGVGAPVTKVEIKEFVYKYDEHFEMHIYDTWGLEPSAKKAEQWKKTIFDEIARHDKESISDWFNTIIFCLNAKSSRIEDFELDIMEQLLREKNHLTIALTHCRSKEDPDGIVLRKSIREELEKRGVDSLEDRNFVFVSNVKKALLGGSVEQFGKEEIFVSIIRNVWASLKSKVPYQARKRFEESFKLKKAELLKKPDKLKWIVPFMKEIRINRLEQEINKNCDAFIRDLVTEINEMYRNAIAYYSELSRKYAIVGFQMNRGDYDTSAKIHFDAMHTVEDQVAADLKLLRKRMRFMNDILSDKKVESTLRDTIISFKILIRDTNKIREDLKAELERFMEAVKQQLEEHLSEIEASLNSLEIDDLYTFQI